VLGYLNLNRELFDRAGEGFVFLLDGETAEEVTAGAGDFARYARWCELTAWDDLLRAGAADVDGTRLEQESWEREEREARDRVERIRKAGGEVATLAEALCDHACALLNLLRAGEALTRCDEAVELTRGADAPSTESRALAGRAAVLCDLLRICEAQQDARRALALARARGRSHLTASADNVLSVSLFLSGQVADALRHAEAAAEAMARIGAAADAAVNLGNAAQDRLLLGDLPGASTTAAAALASAREATAPREEGMALHRVGEVELARGGLAQAAAALGRSLALLGGLRDVPSRVRTLRFLADLRLATGHPTVALETVKGALEQVRRGMSPWGESLLAPTAAAVHLALGAPAAARALVEPASAAARSAGLRLVEARARIALATIAEAEGDLDTARASLGDAHALLAELGIRLLEAEAARHLGRVCLLAGDPSAADTHLAAALSFDRTAGTLPALARDLTELAFLAVRRGDPGSARTQAEEALELVSDCETRLDEPAALAALAAAHHSSGRADLAAPLEARWRRLVEGMGAAGVRAAIERRLAAVGLPARGR